MVILRLFSSVSHVNLAYPKCNKTKLDSMVCCLQAAMGNERESFSLFSSHHLAGEKSNSFFKEKEKTHKLWLFPAVDMTKTKH